MDNKLKSRKLWATIVTTVFMLINAEVNLVPKEVQDSIVALVMVYLGGQSVADAFQKK